MKMKAAFTPLLLIILNSIHVYGEEVFFRWCCSSEPEMIKCESFQRNLATLKQQNVDTEKVIPEFSCVRGKDTFQCMEMIEKDQADVMALDTGQGFFAGRHHNMMPFLAEKYSTVENEGMDYYAVAVAKATDYNLNINTLANRRVCFPGIGSAAGWVYPMGFMLQNHKIPIRECNAVVKSVTDFFGEMCLPGALNSFYNPFGNNPTSICRLCTGILEEKCSTSDPFAGYDGAMKCLSSGVGDVAFIRHDTLDVLSSNSSTLALRKEDYRLLCRDGTRAELDKYDDPNLQCNFGKIKSDMIMTSALKAPSIVAAYKKFLLKSVEWFGSSGTYKSRFTLFDSQSWAHTGRHNIMFSDATKLLVDVGDKDTYYKWVDDDFYKKVDSLNFCPLQYVRWCVISSDEKSKCQMMLMAFNAKDLRPRLDCVLGSSTDNCMNMIYDGDADIMNLDPGDIYTAGRKYGLQPIASEDYGNMESSFYVVAAARKRDHYMTLFNLKQKRVCLPGIGRGDGWVIPLNIFVETEQFLPQYCTIFENLGQLFAHGCIPGASDKEYNPMQQPISLCEGCGSGGAKKCRRNSDENYYGATGAFRCLVELGGDIAFVRHLTVRDNTDSRNRAIWARNRRADDYELLCKDGSRTHIDNWRQCHLGKVPANAIVTAKYKSEADKLIYWQFLNYGQQFFSSDIDGDFSMFDSGKWSSKSWSSDLIFTDDAVRLMKVEPARQNYKGYLGTEFINQIENLQKYTCVPFKSLVNSSAQWTVSFYMMGMSLLLAFFF